MKVIEHGVLHTWKPPETVKCGCGATIGEIERSDLRIYSYEAGDQRDSWTAYGVCIFCPDCKQKIKLSNVPQQVITQIQKDRAEFESRVAR